MKLSLVKVTNKSTNKSEYFGINDKHYDAMLASSGSNLDLEYCWHWLGDIHISEEILNEERFFFKE